ncbi:hypothetical protein [Bradyrhizobium stylosanthis]|uniref:Uncharacterized protein n=1 Tax=Bradyrhizobium stylosanthis TaxID=1803665 RepID=A0A560D545_9BRAD|nr:hypothetical protein [Bradyrhizobium stylosanthis]TWA92236.1 hypothetical protein FBZ96_11129 [Bradyrhizobium stylosanthis]
MNANAALHDIFNARFLANSEVPKTFVAPPSFVDICKRTNTILAGPRGSGKTTLLKMLTPAALENWDEAEEQEIGQLVDYIGVFIPADSVWAKSKESLLGRISDRNLRERAQDWLFLHHITRSFVETLHDIAQISEQKDAAPRCGLRIDREHQVQIADEIVRTLRLKDVNPSFLSILFALDDRLLEFFEVCSGLQGDQSPYSLGEIEPFELVRILVTKVNHLVGRPTQAWALLFDEMEIVDVRVRNYVFAKLRSSSTHFTLKVAIAPFIEDLSVFRQSDGPIPRNDFSLIELWCADREEIDNFCLKFFSKIANSYDLGSTTAFQVLGPSIFDDEREDRGGHSKSYSAETRMARSFKSLYSKDRKFQDYIAGAKLTVNNLSSAQGIDRSKALRKVRNIVVVRDEFLKSEEQDRSRRSAEVYSGARALFAASEGNPRWFLSILSPLIREYARTKRRIDRDRQYRALSDVAVFFKARLFNLPLTRELSNSKVAIDNMKQFVDVFGHFFEENVVGQDFLADPVLSFSTDDSVDSNVRDAIGSALKLGAFVYAEKTEGEFLRHGIAKAKIRISYLLAPEYRLPLMKGKSRTASFILRLREFGPAPRGSEEELPLFGQREGD